jgi:predicted RNA binding protein YcfA (HicA-like mRNA interferase family)
MKYREAARKLRKLGCVELPRNKGSHCKWFNPNINKGSILPDWGSKDLKIGTLHNAVKNLGLDWEDFEKA